MMKAPLRPYLTPSAILAVFFSLLLFVGFCDQKSPDRRAPDGPPVARATARSRMAPSQTLTLGCWWSSDDHCRPRQCETASQKDILVIRRTSRIGPAQRQLLRSDW